MKKFIYNFLYFLIPLLIIPISVLLTDPFDYYDTPFKLDIDRIHIVRKNNVADWTLSELEKIDEKIKEKVSSVSIGDSRGRLLISGGFEKGWSGRVCGKNNHMLDLSFGGAQLDESFSLFEKESNNLKQVTNLLIVLPIDRLLVSNHRNRVETSMFNSKNSDIEYLFNPYHLSYLMTQKAVLGTEVKSLKERQKISSSFLKIYQNSDRVLFEKNLIHFKNEISKLEEKYRITIIIPPYELELYNQIVSVDKGYSYYIQELEKLPIEVIFLQNNVSEYYFYDPVHGVLKDGSFLDALE